MDDINSNSNCIYHCICYFKRHFKTSSQNLLGRLKEISQGNFDVKVFLKNNDELKDLAEGLNDMATKMQRMFLNFSQSKRGTKYHHLIYRGAPVCAERRWDCKVL